MDEKKRIFSAIQPTGMMTLGNYAGAIQNWVKMQDEYECIYAVADLHAITVRQVPADFRKNAMQLMAILLACGIDPDKSLLFFQSHVHQHAELAWILNCYTQMGELSRMTQFKDKSAKHANNINAGLFTYPALMAADILLYQADLVPVGEDQKQHLELCRDIAGRFNGIYGDVLKVPEPYIPKVGARIMSLQNPTSKMSKSDTNVNGYILLTDDTDTIIRKFKRAVTDSDAKVEFKEGKDGINNLISIYVAATGKTVEETVKEFDGKGYGDFKLAVGEAVAEMLRPVTKKYNDLLANKDYLMQVYTKSAEIAEKIAMRTMRKVYKKIGFTEK
ncbi:MAG: tryptophan--tRNA ligase [Clostridia bacterium]|nr:tryptophan--tRNA ligase [Clostridia bacterium]